MIYASVQLMIGERESTCDKKILLYRGDMNVELRFVLKGNRFVVLDNTYAQLIIRRPSAVSVFSSITPVQNDTVIFTVTKDMIDELEELGEYAIQIRLFDDELNARATLPPCNNALIIESPIVMEGGSTVNLALVGNSYVVAVDAPLDVEIFTSDGEYIKTKWSDGDLITDSKLNKIEEALYSINNRLSERIDKNAQDISTILQMIDEPPTYTRPTLSLSPSVSNIAHNVEVMVTLTPRFVQNDAGSIVSYVLTKNGQQIYSNTSAMAYTDIMALSHGASASYNATVSYADGVIKNTSLGIPYPSTSIKAGSISSSTTVRGYALSYYGVIDGDTIGNVEDLDSVLRTSRGSTLTFDMVNQRVVYMYPKSFGNLTSIKDANNFDYINSYTLSSMMFDGVEYNVYILTDAVTISGFRQIFS